MLDGAQSPHQNPKRQRYGNRQRKTEQNAVQGEGRVLEDGAVKQLVHQRGCDLRERRQQSRGKRAAARQRLVHGGRDKERKPASISRLCAIERGAHNIIPQRTTVKRSSRWNTSFSSARPIAPITATPASITSVLRNSRAPKLIQPRPPGTAASISTPTRMRQACARPRRSPVRIYGSAPGRIT